ELAGRFEDALANYAAMETRARESKDRAMELAALIAQATIRSSTSAVRDEEKAKQVSDAALTLARDLKDEAAQAKILWNLSLMYSFSGHPRESVESGEQSIAIARKIKLREQLAYSLNDISFGYMTLGQKENARTSLQDAREIWRALDNKSMLGDNLARAAMLGFLYGDLAASQADATELVEISTRINNLWGLAEATGHQGGLLLEYGEPIEAIRELKASIEYGEQVGHVGAIIAGQLWLAGLYLQLGAVERGIENAEQAEAKAKDSITSWQFWARAILAQSFLLKGEFVQADELANQAYENVPREDFLAFPYAAIAASQTACAIKNYARALDRADQLIAFLDQSGFRAFRADANHARAMAFLGQGDYDQARAALEQARAEAERQNSRRMLWKILAARAECESNQAKAREWRAKSRGVVEYIAAHSPADLRGHFLNLPEVERVMRLA
ncbi:MAG: hypothetical protein HY257_02980, partial [Chloroflexi bacterium]|nr:hypothetical protein [Chloroflexota bacterium]